MSTLDSAKYKLVTYKGMTVPRGYAEGTLTPYEAVVYLKKLGIDESLYFDVQKAILTVESGYKVTSPEGNVKTAGQLINAADDETTWQQFEQNAPQRGWVIEYDESLEMDEAAEGQSSLTEEDFGKTFREALGSNYTIADIRAAAQFYGKQLVDARAAANGDEAQLQRISDAENEVVAGLNEMAESYYKRKEGEKLAEGGGLEATLKEKLDAIIDRYGNFTAYIGKGVVYVDSKDTIAVTLRDIKGSKVKEGRRDFNLGSLMVGLAIADTPASRATLEKLIKAADSHLDEGKQAPVVTISNRDLFTTITPKKGHEVMLEILHPGSVGESDKEKLMAGLRLSNYMREETAETLAEKKDKLQESELMWKIDTNLQAALRGTSSAEYIEAVTNLTEIGKAKEFFQNVFSGNAAVQVVLDFALTGFDTPQYGLVKKVFEELDGYLRMGNGSVSFSGMLKSLVNENGEKLEDEFTLLRESLAQHIKENPIALQAAVTATGLNKLHTAISSALQLDAEQLIYQNLFLNSNKSMGDESVRAAVSRLGGKHLVWDFMEHKGPELAKNLAGMVRHMKARSMGDSQLLADPKMAGAIETEVRKLGYDEPLTKEIVKTIQRRAEKNSALMESAFGDSLTGLEVRDAAHRGAMAMFISAFQPHIRGESEKFDMSGSLARMVTRVLAGSFDGYAAEVGSFFAGTQAVFAEIMNRARVFPRLDDSDNFSWGGNTAFREAILQDYLKMHPESTSQVIDDVTLMKHASHTKSEFFAHYLLVGNIQSNAEFITGASGERIFTNERDIQSFTNSVESVNLNDPRNLAETTRVASSFDAIDRTTRDLLGTGRADKRFMTSLTSEGFNPSDYGDVSLSSAAAEVAAIRKGMGRNAANKVMENFQSLVASRVSAHTTDQAVIDYITEQVGNGAGNGGKTGHAFEILSGLPTLMHHIKETGMISATRTAEGSPVDGLAWTGSDGKSHSFGKIPGALNGTVDFLQVSYGEDGIEIHPVEGKMEKTGGAIPHHGNPDNFSRIVAELWRTNGRGKVRIFPTVVTNAPHGSPGDTGSGMHALSMDYSAKDIQAVGRTFHKGSLISGTEMMRRIS